MPSSSSSSRTRLLALVLLVAVCVTPPLLGAASDNDGDAVEEPIAMGGDGTVDETPLETGGGRGLNRKTQRSFFASIKSNLVTERREETTLKSHDSKHEDVPVAQEVEEKKEKSLPARRKAWSESFLNSVKEAARNLGTRPTDYSERERRLASMRRRWDLTFQEIRTLSSTKAEPAIASNIMSDPDIESFQSKDDDMEEEDAAPKPGRRSFSEAWKSFLEGDESAPKRFDGFATWEKRLQQWKEDVAEYIASLDEEAEYEYPMATYGRPSYQSLKSAEKANVDESRPPAPLEAIVQRREEGGETFTTIKPRPAQPAEAVLPHTDVSDLSKRLWIVTTAALPWMTGTAVNPLLRAAYLTKGRAEAGGSVTLMLPWLEKLSDREKIYGAKSQLFQSSQEQEQYIRNWLNETANMPQASQELNIRWYTAWQEPAENSVYCMGDLTAEIPAEEVDICILEEPEHLNWYRAPGEHWTNKFPHVVGIVHTNYFVYAQEQPGALIRAPAMRLLCSWMCRAHCHRIIKLSGTLGKFAQEKELVENVHGVRGSFLDIGQEVRQILTSSKSNDHPVFSADSPPSVYFIGKMLWSKGLGSLMELTKYAEESAGLRVKVDMYGGGPDKDAAEKRSKQLNLDMTYHGPLDHSALGLTHKVFVNPSTSEVLCTTTAEALAMGKFVIIPSHPSNDFFAQFPNCLPYTNKEEFVGNLYYALTHAPEPMVGQYAHALSWDAATERFAAAAAIPVAESEALEEAIARADAGIEIGLPPLIEDEKRRNQIKSTFNSTRQRYELFRERLLQEVEELGVLPRNPTLDLLREMDKRLDVDIDEVLESPKLRFKLSPAELDKQLLDLYASVTAGPGGDVVRVVGGGMTVGMQKLYLKQQARKRRRAAARARRGKRAEKAPLKVKDEAEDDDDEDDEEEGRPTKSIRRALARNLFQSSTPLTLSPSQQRRRSSVGPRMCIPMDPATVRSRRFNMPQPSFMPKSRTFPILHARPITISCAANRV